MTPSLLSFSDYVRWEAAKGGFTSQLYVEIDGVRRQVAKLDWFARCPYCQDELLMTDRAEQFPTYAVNLEHGLFSCRGCPWWYQKSTMNVAAHSVSETHWYIFEGVLRTFSLSDRSIPLSDLQRHLHNNVSDVRYVDPSVFERLIADVYRAIYPGAEVRHVGGPGDGGIDIYLVIKDEPVAIQVKRRQNLQSTEGFQMVSALCGAMMFKNVRKGLLITTAARFGQSSIRAVDELRSRTGIEIELKALADLEAMLGLRSVTESSAPRLRGFGFDTGAQ